jgi:uncharacterized protein with FMN-binding domain
MRRITLWLLSTVAAVVLLFSYRTSLGGSAVPAVAAAPANPGSTSASSGGDPTSTASPSASASSGDSSGSSSSSGKSGTFSGQTAGTRWGDVQVTITVTNGKITAVNVPVYPNGNGRDQEINAFALPTLVQETLQAQSADIQTVSGATVTSDGYLQSLQSALDAAGLK